MEQLQVLSKFSKIKYVVSVSLHVRVFHFTNFSKHLNTIWCGYFTLKLSPEFYFTYQTDQLSTLPITLYCTMANVQMSNGL